MTQPTRWNPLRRSLGRLPTAALSLLACSLVGAQSTPDAGALRRQIEQDQIRALPTPSASPFPLPQPLESLGGATVTVQAFGFSGNTLLGDETLAKAVGEFTNQPVDFSGLQNAALAVAAAYRNAGWIVRVYLPEQDVSNGTVAIQIVEARLGSVQIDGGARRISSGRIRRVVEDAQSPGAPVNSVALDRALLLVGDLPGVIASGRLRAGLTPAETDLVLTISDAQMLNGKAYADNSGSRFTGEGRLIADATINGPFRIGDRAEAAILYSQGSTYVRTGYSLPLGHDGLRTGVNASHLGYSIVTGDFAALDAHGTATTVGVDASYPLLRSRHRNLYLDFNLGTNRFNNKSGGMTSTRYVTRVASLALHGNLFDSLGNGGVNSASLTFSLGETDLGGSPNRAIDAMTASTAGSFHKALATLSRHQAITDRLSVYAGVAAQFANRNLDSSERFYLGGAGGVRAYPANEGGGSHGMLMTVEARASLSRQFDLTGFFDAGRIEINADNNFVGATPINTVTLKGAGVAVGWTAPIGLNVKATVARRIGRNPNPTSTGMDQDGSRQDNRFWLQASLPF